MPTFSDPGWPNLVNIMKRLTPAGGIEALMAELMSQKLAILDDIPWKEGNLPTGELITSRTALPSPSWRRFNQGVDPTKSTTVQFEEGCGMLSTRSEVDCDLADLNGNAAAFRESENKAHLEGFAQTLETAFLYENAATNPERIHGLSARYAATTGYTASGYVSKGTVAGVNAHSIWLINWAPDKLYGIFPKGSMAGLKQQDMGKLYVEDSSNRRFLAFCTQFDWKCGLAVKDYRYAARHQWDPDDTNYEDADKSLYLQLQTMLGTVYDLDAAHARFYMDRTSFAKLNAQLASNSANFLEYVEAGKKRIPSFMGVPIRITDALVAESAIS